MIASWIVGAPSCSECAGEANQALYPFSWGGCRSSDYTAGPIYKVGQPILWLVLGNGSIPANARFTDSGQFNSGAPHDGRVDLLSLHGPERCRSCGHSATPVISIVDNFISRLFLGPTGDVPDDLLGWIFGLDGTVEAEIVEVQIFPIPGLEDK